MDEQSKAALDLLVQNGYLEIVKGKYRPTKELNSLTTTEKLICGMDGKPITGTWGDIYTRFIMDCKIPRQGESGTGDMYDLNKYSEDAMQKFKGILMSGIDYALLVKVTQAYYRNGTNRYKKKIGNYIVEGLWRMDYEVMKGQTEQQQQQTIQQQLNESKPFTRDRIG